MNVNYLMAFATIAIVAILILVAISVKSIYSKSFIITAVSCLIVLVTMCILYVTVTKQPLQYDHVVSTQEYTICGDVTFTEKAISKSYTAPCILIPTNNSVLEYLIEQIELHNVKNPTKVTITVYDASRRLGFLRVPETHYIVDLKE